MNDPNRAVRLKAGLALASLMKIHSRADPLFLELLAIIKNGGEEQGVRDTCLQALRWIVGPCGDKISDNIRKSLIQALTTLLSNLEDQTRLGAAGCLGALVKWMNAEEQAAFLSDYVFGTRAAFFLLGWGRPQPFVLSHDQQMTIKRRTGS